MQPIPELGVGFLFHHTKSYYQLLDHLDVEPDCFELLLGQYSTEIDVLDDLREYLGRPLVFHSNQGSFGTATPQKEAALARINERIERARALYLGDHICFTGVPGYYAAGLIPPPLTEQQVEVFAENIKTAQKKIKVPIILENVVMHYNPIGELSLAEFIGQVLERADIGMVLSLENISQCSSYSPVDHYELINELPLDRVQQIHCTLGNLQEQKRLGDGAPYRKQVRHFEVLEYLATRIRPKSLIWEFETEVPSVPDPSYVSERIEWARELFFKRSGGDGRSA